MQTTDLVPNPYLENGSGRFHIHSYRIEAGGEEVQDSSVPNSGVPRPESKRNIVLESTSEISQSNYHVKVMTVGRRGQRFSKKLPIQQGFKT